jgi:hypothetical protein
MPQTNRSNPARCGILCIDQPAGFTSFDVIAKARGMLRQRSMGTLARGSDGTGVLPLFLGGPPKARLSAADQNLYRDFRLGVTPTRRISPHGVRERPVPVTAAAGGGSVFVDREQLSYCRPCNRRCRWRPTAL